MPALEAVAADIKNKNIDLVFNLGDNLSGPLFPVETAEFLMSQNWLHILGNHDRQLIEQKPEKHGPSDKYAYKNLTNKHLDWLKSLPKLVEKDLVTAFHGTPQSDLIYLLETIENKNVRLASPEEISKHLVNVKNRILVCGHSHVQRLIKYDELTCIINPGSVGLQAYIDDSSNPHKVENGSPHARYAVVELNDGSINAKMICIDYDYRVCAKEAAKNSRYDWEEALLTGYVQKSISL
jgi:predicted phosphodiesterase